MVETADAMTTPNGWGDAPLPHDGSVPLYEDPAERFEMIAQQVPDKERLLSDASDVLRLTYGLPSL